MSLTERSTIYQSDRKFYYKINNGQVICILTAEYWDQRKITNAVEINICLK